MLACFHHAAGVLLRATPTASTRGPAALAVPSPVKAVIDAATAQAATSKLATPTYSAATPSAPVSTQKPSKVDVGFSDFDGNLKGQVEAALRSIPQGSNWTSDMRSEFSKNATDSLKEHLASALKPLKMTIGKTWMALPEDEQKAEYVKQLRASFAPIFVDSLKTAADHMKSSLKRIGSFSDQKTQMAPSDLLAKSEVMFGESLFLDHCYVLDSKKAADAPHNKLCMKSVLNGMAHRLNDTLGLISMTMRFDARAMSLAQQQKKSSPSQQKKSTRCSQGGACNGAWDRKAPYGKDGNHICSWKQMTPGWYLDKGKAPKMCLREYNDAVSDYFKAQGLWHSCLDVAAAWRNLPDGSRFGKFADRLSCGGKCQAENGTAPGIYVDVGANIGTCVMQMLARMDVAQVVAFEPSPANLFYLTSSASARIKEGDTRARDNLILYPKALGSERSIHKLFEQPGNAGNTGVDVTVMGKEMEGVSVETITLDEVFMSGAEPPYIHLMKVDAQGYEVKILQGAPRLLASGAINALHIEIAPWWLAAQKASVLQYVSLLHVNKYDLRVASSSHFLSAPELAKLACDLDKNGTLVDMFVLRNRVEEQGVRSPLQCLP